MVRISKELVIEAVEYCALKYKFSAEEALREMLIEEPKVVGKEGKKECKKEVKKGEFPLPYNGEYNVECCQALRQNNGLYTQCQGIRRGETEFCKSCAGQMQKRGNEIPEYGTIKMRNAVGIFEYIDPKGRKPTAYAKVMNKYKLTKEQVLEEAKKMNMEINEEHFVVPEETKRGRPSKEKEPKEKGTRGRPKKSKKIIEIDNECEDLFASLVANANEVEDVKSEEEIIIKQKAEEAEKEAKKAAEKAEKEAKKSAEKAAKEAKLAAEKAEKEAKLAAEKAEKEAKKKAEEEEKAAKKLAAEKAKAEKEAAKAAKSAAKAEKVAVKELKEAPKPSATTEEEEEEPDVVKKIEFEGKKYLKSKKTGIIYDYNEYTKNGEQVVVGKWNDASNKIELTASEEEEDEEDYEM